MENCPTCGLPLDPDADGYGACTGIMEWVADPYAQEIDDKVIYGWWCQGAYMERKDDI